MIKKESFLYSIAFTMDACFAFTGLCVPLLALQLGATYGDLGLISAAGALTYSVSCLLSGRLADRLGYRRIMSGAAGLMIGIFILYLFSSLISHLIALSIATGLALSGFWPVLQAWIGQGKDRHGLRKVLGGFNLSWTLGTMVGPILGGYVFEIDPRRIFSLGAVFVGIVFVGLLALRLKEARSEQSGESADSFPEAAYFLPMAWWANLASFFVTGILRSLFPKLAIDLLIPPSALGYLYACRSLSQLLTFLVLTRTHRWQFRLLPLFSVQVFAVFGLYLFVLAESPFLFAVAFAIHGLQTGTTFASSIFYSLFAQKKGGKRSGIHESLVGIGFFLGPLAGGLVADYMGPRTPYLFSMGIVILALGIQIMLFVRRSKLPSPGRKEDG